MRRRGKFLFLGTGASTGVPVIGCRCTVCSSCSPYNQRLRPSGLFQIENRAILVDVGPDFRQQALKHHIHCLDGVLLTHTHFDHIAGIDELRTYYIWQKKPLPFLLSQESLQELKNRYPYLFQPMGVSSTLSAQLQIEILPSDRGEVAFLGEKIGYFSYFQGPMKVTGYRLGDFAYVSDIRSFDEKIFETLRGVKTLVVSALRKEASQMMFSVEEAIAFSRKVGAEVTWLTHMNHEIDYDIVNRELPSRVQLAYDGLEVELGFSS